MRYWSMVAVGLLLLAPDFLTACPSCFGAADAPMTEGMNMAILSLMGVTGGVLVGFVSFFVRLRKRTRQFVEASHVSITD